MSVVESIEWRARREALGLPQDVFARLIGASQDVVSKWEHGRRSPRDPVGVHMRVAELEEVLEDLVAQIVADVTVGGDPVELVTYASDEDWWAEWYHTAPALELPKDFTKIVHAADGSTFLIKKSLFSIYVSDGAGNNAPLKQVKTVADVHNLTEDDVKQAYKAKADYLSNKNQPKKATSKPHSSNYKLVKLEDSKVITPPKASDPHGGYLGGRLFVGGKADTETREVAKSMREDIKKAIAAGELPSDLKYGVRKRPGSYDWFEISIANSRGGRAVAVSENEQKSEGFRNTKEYLENLSRQYFSDDSNAMVDYFNSHNSTSVAFRSDWDDRERERLEQRRSK